jgi:hypothetical protein
MLSVVDQLLPKSCDERRWPTMGVAKLLCLCFHVSGYKLRGLGRGSDLVVSLCRSVKLYVVLHWHCDDGSSMEVVFSVR